MQKGLIYDRCIEGPYDDQTGSLREGQQRKKELKMHRYSMRTYLSLKLLGSFFAVTVAYGLGAVAVHDAVLFQHHDGRAWLFPTGISSESCWSCTGVVMAVNLIHHLCDSAEAVHKDARERKSSTTRVCFALKKYLDKEEQLQ